MRRSLSTIFGVVLFAASLAFAVPAPPAGAVPNGWSWSGDYATEELGDPWDFSNAEDWDIQARAESPGAVGSVGGGVLSFDQTRTAGGVLLGSAHYGEQALQWGRSTWLRPINTDAYRTLSFRMYQPSAPPVGGVELFSCGGTVPTCATHIDFFPTAGWNTYTITLPAGLTVYSVLIVPGPDQRGGFQLDWVRITRAGGQVAPPANGSEPVPVVLDPNRGGGPDYAADVRGKAWSFDDASDIIGIYELDGVSYSGGAFRGCSTSNDPAVVFAMGAPLVADVYNRVDMRVWYDGPFGLADAPGGGMVARLKWHVQGIDGYQTSQDIVVYPGWNDIALTMLTFPPNAVTEPDIGLGAGWVGLIDEIRLDFHEDPGRRCVALDSFAVRAADQARPGFSIRYRDDANGIGSPSPGTRAEIFLDKSVGTFAGTRIAEGLAVNGGDNTFNWSGAGVGKGVYFPWVRLTDANGRQSSAYATGPLVTNGVPPLAAKATTRVSSGAPGGVAAVLANITMTESLGGGFVTADTCEDVVARSNNKSNGNYNAGQNIANLGVIPITGGDFCLFNESPVHLLADVQGYFSTGGNSRFTRFGPTRVLETRPGPRVGAGSVTRVASGVPGGATAALVNLTMTDGVQGGFITADRCDALEPGDLPPTKSNGNFIPQRNVANLAVVPLGGDGSFCIFTESEVHLLADVQGYFSTGGQLGFTLIDPIRAIDTRPLAQPGANTVSRVNPRVGNADAVLVNITMTEAPGGGYITAGSCNTLLPPRAQPVSNGNFVGGQNIANLSVVSLDADGTFCVYTERPVDLIVDVQGTFTSNGPLRFTSIAPDRRLDTRKP